MKLKRLLQLALSLLLLAVSPGLATAQPDKKSEAQIVLPKTLQNSRMEFSSMAWYRNELLLVPQYPDRFGGQIYGISRSAVNGGIGSGKAVNYYTTWIVDGLDEIKNKIGSTYEGFESTVIRGKNIYFTIESSEKNADCYLIRGRFSGDRIILDPTKIVSLPKEKRLSNAGFESLAWWPEEKRLLSFFEYNKEAALAKIMVIDPATLKVETPLPLPVLPFRITEMVYSKDKEGNAGFLGINHLYIGKKENAEYIGADSLVTDEPSLAGKNLKHTNYTRIMRLIVAPNHSISWKKVRDIDFTDANWEGIALFKNGVLLITDEYPSSVLKWFSLN